MKLSVRSRTRDRACIIDLVSRLEQGTFGAGLFHDSRGIPAQDLVFGSIRLGAGADLCVYRIHGDRPDLNQEVPPLRLRCRNADIEQRFRIFNG